MRNGEVAMNENRRSVRAVVLGLLQAIVWPVYLVYHLLEVLAV